MDDCLPVLISSKALKPEFKNFHKIALTSSDFTLGRARNNTVIFPFISISRNHCTFKKFHDRWIIEDSSSFGIKVNGTTLGKGVTKMLEHGDVIILEPSEEFVYTFTKPSDDFEIPRKRIKLEKTDSDEIFNNVKLKFEESQSHEIKHIEERIQTAKNMQATSMMIKDRLQSDMNKKMLLLEIEFASQIENLKGEKNEVEKQKAMLIAERDAQLASVKEEMNGKISDLMNQIQKHNETETELLNENNNLKEKLLKEREEFLAELNRESSSKQDLLEKLEAKMQEQEETRLKEKQELELMLRKETELLRITKEKELRELEELKKQRETELEQELDTIRKDLELQVQHAAEERLKAEQILSEHMEQRKKLTDEETTRTKQLMQEREEINNKLTEAQVNAQKSIEELQKRVAARETELAALAADRIQKQAEQSSEVISSLQEQLEKVKNELKSVETEKNTLLENIVNDNPKEGSSKESTLAHVGELMESELQCSICAELFVTATTLNCAHTFCKYCITMWKKKKKDCPICRTGITSECKSLVLDSFIDKMVQNLTEDMKTKREALLKAREEVVSDLARQLSAGTSRRSNSYDDSDSSPSGFLEEGGEEEEELDEDYDDYDSYWPYHHRHRYYAESSDADANSGFDDDSDDSDERAGTPAGDSAAATADGGASGAAAVSDSTDGRANGDGSTRRRGNVPGVPGAYYGGYGRCFNCGARGHWAPGCPNR